MAAASNSFLERAHELLATTPLIDGHNDLAIALRGRVGGIGVSSVDLRQAVDGLDTDIPRLRAGRVGGQFWSVWVPAELPGQALPIALEQLDIADGFAGRYPACSSRATTADEVDFGLRKRPDRVVARSRGRRHDRELAADPADLLRARHPIHDADPLEDDALGRRRD